MIWMGEPPTMPADVVTACPVGSTVALEIQATVSYVPAVVAGVVANDVRLRIVADVRRIPGVGAGVGVGVGVGVGGGGGMLATVPPSTPPLPPPQAASMAVAANKVAVVSGWFVNALSFDVEWARIYLTGSRTAVKLRRNFAKESVKHWPIEIIGYIAA